MSRLTTERTRGLERVEYEALVEQGSHHFGADVSGLSRASSSGQPGRVPRRREFDGVAT
jgi:hypothetical protein